MNESLRALYAGDGERAEALLPPDDELDVFTAAAFGRVGRLERLLREDPSLARAFALDSALANGNAELVRLLESRGGEPRVS